MRTHEDLEQLRRTHEEAGSSTLPQLWGWNGHDFTSITEAFEGSGVLDGPMDERANLELLYSSIGTTISCLERMTVLLRDG